MKFNELAGFDPEGKVIGGLLFVTNCIPCAKYQKARPDPENTKILNYLCLTPFLMTPFP